MTQNNDAQRREAAIVGLRAMEKALEQPNALGHTIVHDVTVAGSQCIEYEIFQRESDGIFILTWGDCVANTWEETFAHLAVAYVRLGTLLYGTEINRLFAQEGDAFVPAAYSFMDGETR